MSYSPHESLDVADTDLVADVYRYDVVAQTVVLVSVNDDESEITRRRRTLGVDATGDHIYFSTGCWSVDLPRPRHHRHSPPHSMPTETGFITRPGTSLVINTATSHSGADTDALVDAYLYDIVGTPRWTLISDRAFGLPTGIAISPIRSRPT